MNLKKLFYRLLILINIAISFFVVGMFTSGETYASSPTIEFYFETIDNKKSVTNEEIQNEIKTLGRGAASYQGIELDIYAKSLSANLELVTMDIQIELNDDYGIIIRDFLPAADNSGYDIWISNVNRYPQVDNLISLYYDTTSGFDFETITTAGVLIGTVAIEINADKISSLADIEIKMVHTEDSLMYPESTDITYGTGSGEGYRLDEIVLTPFVIGDPDSGPDASLSSLKVEGESTTYLNLTNDIEEDPFIHEVTVSYADNKIENGIAITALPKKASADVQMIGLAIKPSYTTGDIVVIKVTDGPETKNISN